MINQHGTGFLMFSKTGCGACETAKKAIRSRGLSLHVIDMKNLNFTLMNECQDYLLEITGARTVPRIFFNRRCIGGSTEVLEILAKHQSSRPLSSTSFLGNLYAP